MADRRHLLHTICDFDKHIHTYTVPYHIPIYPKKKFIYFTLFWICIDLNRNVSVSLRCVQSKLKTEIYLNWIAIRSKHRKRQLVHAVHKLYRRSFQFAQCLYTRDTMICNLSENTNCTLSPPLTIYIYDKWM